ncbi:GIY-YIG nuclease family protein [Streptomyces xanthophaeus]|uniref:GIY-YIG nuclease family protein n=1 Tax=Streptomyces xanthophaeus TaxID=67385 RepID=UPI002647DA3F|nr:GIY-YIG nuclease family protein [Streptomyces xanthophaeus]WKD36517.1 GIY-YIG nuclease family protein [Streptomyces xanthophaeus]
MYEDICVPLGCHNPFHEHHNDSRLSRLVDPQDPAFDSILQVLSDMAAAAVDFTPEIVEAAVKAGQARHARKQPTPTLAAAPRQKLPTGPVVYYVRRGNLIKIGTTTRLHRRMNELMPDEILAVEPGGEALEHARHEEFRELALTSRGEYFFPSPALIAHLERVRSEHGAPPAGLPCLREGSRRWALASTQRLV